LENDGAGNILIQIELYFHLESERSLTSGIFRSNLHHLTKKLEDPPHQILKLLNYCEKQGKSCSPDFILEIQEYSNELFAYIC
jgi:hypothetical protein